ncbi:MAG: 3-deoxy-manno-octulosonate cytidylyltransferase [bacterium]
MISIVIPIRLKSKRFPNKIIQLIKDKPLLDYLLDQTNKFTFKKECIIITDSHEIKKKYHNKVDNIILSDKPCSCGTERITNNLEEINSPYILNIQADEALSNLDFINRFTQEWKKNTQRILTPIYQINTLEKLRNKNVVKVVKSSKNQALYFSRQCIPYFRDLEQTKWLQKKQHWGHVGIYAYTKDILQKYNTHKNSSLENIEKLEQLRFLDMTIPIHTFEVDEKDIKAVDSPEDLKTI